MDAEDSFIFILDEWDSRDEILSAMVVYGFLAYYDGYLTDFQP